MIARLRGILLEPEFSRCVVDVGGVGYDVQIPLSTFDKLPREGETVTLFISTQVREDAIVLFGFASAEEKRLFETLLGVSGIGGKLALSILSGLPLESLCSAIANGDIKLLSQINGVGKRTAERLVVDLRDRIGKLGLHLAAAGALPKADDPRHAAVTDALMALSQLGFKSDQAQKIVTELAAELPEAECGSENLLRLAIQKLSGR